MKSKCLVLQIVLSASLSLSSMGYAAVTGDISGDGPADPQKRDLNLLPCLSADLCVSQFEPKIFQANQTILVGFQLPANFLPAGDASVVIIDPKTFEPLQLTLSISAFVLESDGHYSFKLSVPPEIFSGVLILELLIRPSFVKGGDGETKTFRAGAALTNDGGTLIGNGGDALSTGPGAKSKLKSQAAAGGGCQLQSSESKPISWGAIALALLGGIFIFRVRRGFKAYVC